MYEVIDSQGIVLAEYEDLKDAELFTDGIETEETLDIVDTCPHPPNLFLSHGNLTQ
jgi:hypothetical protein